MAITVSSPVTGAAITGLSSPTYTLVTDTAPGAGKQYAVTALGGTQTGVEAHSVSKPFTLSAFRPGTLRVLPGANPVTGVIKNVPVNTYKVITRKGAAPAANQPNVVARVTTVLDIPAGTDSYSPAELKAMLSLHFGALTDMADGIADTALTGIL